MPPAIPPAIAATFGPPPSFLEASGVSVAAAVSAGTDVVDEAVLAVEDSLVDDADVLSDVELSVDDSDELVLVDVRVGAEVVSRVDVVRVAVERELVVVSSSSSSSADGVLVAADTLRDDVVSGGLNALEISAPIDESASSNCRPSICLLSVTT